MGDSERFVTVMKNIVGKRLTYKELIGKEGGKRKPSIPREGRGKRPFLSAWVRACED